MGIAISICFLIPSSHRVAFSRSVPSFASSFIMLLLISRAFNFNLKSVSLWTNRKFLLEKNVSFSTFKLFSVRKRRIEKLCGKARRNKRGKKKKKNLVFEHQRLSKGTVISNLELLWWPKQKKEEKKRSVIPKRRK